MYKRLKQLLFPDYRNDIQYHLWTNKNQIDMLASLAPSDSPEKKAVQCEYRDECAHIDMSA